MHECMDHVMKAAESDMGVLVKINMNDGFKSGLQEEQCLEVAKALEKTGAHALVLSGGFVSKAPMYVMRGQMPIHTMTHYMDQAWLKYSVRMFGGIMVPKHKFMPLYFLDQARMFRKELKMPLVYVGGVTSREDADKIIDEEGFEFLQMGRALLNDPEFVNKMKADGKHKSGCDHVNYCIARMYSKEMACYQHMEGLPGGICREIEKIKASAK